MRNYFIIGILLLLPLVSSPGASAFVSPLGSTTARLPEDSFDESIIPDSTILIPFTAASFEALDKTIGETPEETSNNQPVLPGPILLKPFTDLVIEALLKEIEATNNEEADKKSEQTPLEELEEIDSHPPSDGFHSESGEEIRTEAPKIEPLPTPVVTYDIPIIQNKAVDKYILLFQTRLRKNFEKWLVRSGRYVPMMREILREHDLPQDLVYLALIESGFNPKAFSRARASGPWQFISATGKNYGLRINRWIDERRDPVKSTHAAAKYLKDLYRMFDTWPLAMASYNAGEGRIRRALRKTRTKDFWELRKTRRIHRETRNYVPKFMAAILIAKDPEKYGFHVKYEEPVPHEEVIIRQVTYLSSIAKASNISLKELKTFNPELKRSITPPNLSIYRLKLPVGRKEIFLANFSPEKEKKVVIGKTFKHRVRRGETVSSIARKYGVSMQALFVANSLSRRGFIRAGQRLTISNGFDDTDIHHVRRGESLSTIARKYRVSLRRLLQVNHLRKTSVIQPGQALVVPNRSFTTTRRGHKHRIRRGETISSIARKYAIRMSRLLKANRLRKTSIIRAGHYLVIP
ncbi:MAG: LysM peptidoglycan-binding domain-containing protein [Nitrospira sp.]